MRWALALGAAAWVLAGCGDDEEHGEEHGEHGEEHGEHGEEHGEHGEEHQEEGEDPEDVVRVTPAAIRRAGIVIGTAASGRLSGSVLVPAEVQLNPDRTAHVTTLASGQIVEAHASLGDRVTKGQVLARLRSVDMSDARGAVGRARAELDVARAALERQEEMQRAGIGARGEFMAARGAFQRAQAEYRAATDRVRTLGSGGGGAGVLTITSPLDGIVIERHATAGEAVEAETDLYVVADLSDVWVVGRVYDQNVAAAREGVAATVSLQAYPGRVWEGTVAWVAATLDEETRTLALRVEVDNAEGVIRPGMFGSIRIPAPGEAMVPLPIVPEEAVERIGDREVVFVPGEEEGEFHAVPVTVGGRAEGRAEIQSGIEPGARVVVRGSFVLKSQLLASQIGHGHAH